MRLKIKLVLAIFFFSVIFSPSYAGSEIETLIQMLYENGTVSEEQYGRLMAELRQNQAQAKQEKQQLAEQIAEANKPADTQVQIKGGGLTVKTSDGQFSTRLGGRLQLDAASYSGRPEMGDGTEVRRAYMTLQGKMYQDWGYRLQYNFANTGANGKGILDAYIDYTGFDDVKFRVGHFKEPFTLHEAVSDNFTTFTERAMPAAFSPGRSMGLMASHAEADWTWAVGLFGESVSRKGGTDDEGWGASGRLTFAPVNQQDKLIHLGLGLNYRDVADSGVSQFKQGAETHVSGVNIVDTGAITDSESVFKAGAEFASVMGPFSTQAEYISSKVNRNKASDLDFDGWYIEAGYFLTGESRPYKKGKFTRPIAKRSVAQGGIGAWQLALRYSTLDLSDSLIDGGEADAMTLGLNWYPVPTLRFTANYIDVLQIDGGTYDGQEPSVVQLRSQWAF